MVALNFMEQMAPPVEALIKRQTIREKVRCKPGDSLQLYTGMRTKDCRKLLDATCTAVQPISIHEEFYILLGTKYHHPDALAEMAILDGFKTWREMVSFFSTSDQGLPFTGFLIKWRPDCHGS